MQTEHFYFGTYSKIEKNTMKLRSVSALLALLGQAGAFTTSPRPSFSSSLRMANVLEGKEIAGDFLPINNMLLVKKAEIVDQTEGGIFLTGKGKIKKSEGDVTACGDGKINSETGFKSPMPVAVGESVCFGKFDGEEVKYNDVIHTLIRDDDVLVKFSSSDAKTLENAEVVWDNVLVRVQEEKMEATGGLLIAATTKKATISSVGEVLKVGPGRLAFNGVLMEMDVQVGDYVKFRDYAAQDVEIEGEKYAVLKMSDLLAKF